MARAVYSARFLIGAVNSSGSPTFLSFTVPAGRVAVVKQFTYAKIGGAVATGSLSVGPAPADVAYYSAMPATTYVTAGGIGLHIVANAGEIIRVDAVAGAFRVTVSGFLLLA